MAAHIFQIGQAVELMPALSRNVPGGFYVVTKQLPEGTGELEYRVKSVKEPHEADQSATSPLRSRPGVQMLRRVLKCRQPPLFAAQTRSRRSLLSLPASHRPATLFASGRCAGRAGGAARSCATQEAGAGHAGGRAGATKAAAPAR